MNQLVLSDVDGTLVKGSLVLNHACFLHESGVMNLGDTVRDWKRSKKNEERIGALAEAYRAEIVGRTVENVGACEFINEICRVPKNFYSTLDRLIKLREAGIPVYLISGSPSFLITPFARKFKFRSKGSLYHTDDDGAFTGECSPMYNSEAKERFIRTLNLDNKHVLAFGDTSSDAPLFRVAKHSVLVAPNSSTRNTLAGLYHEEISK